MAKGKSVSAAQRVASPQPTAPSHAAAAPSWFITLLVAAVAFGAYVNTLGHQFTLDDPLIIVENPLIRDLRNLPTIFTTHYWAGQPYSPSHGLYRPLTVASYALNYAVHGLSPLGYHVVNVALHALVTALLYRLLARLFGAGYMTTAAALLFAVHPIHTEAVANVAGRAELLALGGILLCCSAYDRARAAAAAAGERGRCAGWMAVSAVGYLGGALSKEIGFVAPLIVLLTELLLPERRWLLLGKAADNRGAPRRGRVSAVVMFVGYAVAAALFLALRAHATEGSEAAGVWRQVAGPQRVATALRVVGEYAGLLAVPWTLLAEYWVTDVPIATSFAEPGVVGGLLVIAAIIAAAIVCRRRAPAVSWGIGLMAITLLPASNLLFPIGVMKAERILYSPSAGFVCVLAALLAFLVRRAALRPVAWTLLFVLTAAYAGRTWVRNGDWRDPDALCDATLAESPQSPIFNTHLATRLAREGKRAEARERFEYVLTVAPRSVNALNRLAMLEHEERNYARAIELYRRVLELRPRMVDAWTNLATAYSATGDWDNAIACLERAREFSPADPRSFLNLVNAHLSRKRPDAALPVIEDALRRFPRHGLTHLFAAWVYTELGRAAEAAAHTERAYALDPSLRRAARAP